MNLCGRGAMESRRCIAQRPGFFSYRSPSFKQNSVPQCSGQPLDHLHSPALPNSDIHPIETTATCLAYTAKRLSKARIVSTPLSIRSVHMLTKLQPKHYRPAVEIRQQGPLNRTKGARTKKRYRSSGAKSHGQLVMKSLAMSDF